ncbi:threonine ammonia-lyase, partial [Staphylococcus pseudintermedius]
MATNAVMIQTEKYCNIHDIKEAKMKIQDYVRETPLIKSMFLSNNTASAGNHAQGLA